MKKLLLQLLIAVSFVTPFINNSEAQEITGVYGKVALGADYLDGYDFKSANQNNSYIDAKTDFDIGSVGVLAAGYRFKESFALELEYAQRTHGINSVEVTNGDLLSTGDMKAKSIMVNAIYYLTSFEYVNPYAGIGFGFLGDTEQQVEIAGFGSSHKSNSDAFALQLMLGLEVPITREFRFFTETRAFTASSPDVSNSTSTYNVAYDTASVMAGLVYIFPKE